MTTVARAYAIGRVTADGNAQAFLETQPKRTVAFTRACELAGTGTGHHVFFSHPQTHKVVLVEKFGDAMKGQYDSEPDSARFARLTRRVEQLNAMLKQKHGRTRKRAPNGGH